MKTATTVATVPAFGDLTGLASDSSGNVTAPGWTDFLALPWLVRPSTPPNDPDAEERRTWAQLARKARKRWQEENPY